MNLKDYLPTGGPGFTDYPENDIRTHRKIASSTRWIGIFALIGISAQASRWMEPQLFGVAAIAYLMCMHASTHLRLQALEWENELTQNE